MESGKGKNKKTNSNLGTPQNFLIPLMLLHLRNWNSHGYELMEKITQFGVDSIDQGNFYRLLRKLEKDSLVSSEWDTTTKGPAKRIYAITEEGQQYLDMWAGSLSQYQTLLNNFFHLYNPFFPLNQSSQKKEEKDS
ncbi:poly-beta-hydroxybutyrate-responsive repressor [Rummeliibacillus pycnus]|uniref:poly-beta-hydroxybutyrate-responsive repressor n=1 Tax=Rummeliibacillus pycnus TaxID=101070 RepID=UPI003D2E68F5